MISQLCSTWSRSTAALAIWMAFYRAPASFGQVNPVGSLDGEVRDPSSAFLTGTQVDLINVGTNGKRSTTTNERGVYCFNLLPPGEYRLEIEQAAGGRRHTRSPWQKPVPLPVPASKVFDCADLIGCKFG